MNRKKSRDVKRISPEDALQFLEDIRILSSDIGQSSIAISLRVPENILNIIKVKAKADGKKYQSFMIEILRNGIRDFK